jgi:hypothetical protein
MQRNWSCAGLLAVLVIAPGFAKDVETPVIAHVPLTGSAATQLSRQDLDGKRYLYVVRPVDRSITILDVTLEEKPSVVRTVILDRLKAHAGFHLLPNAALLVSQTEGPNAQQAANLSSLALWNPATGTDPKHLADVHSYLVESRRGLLYLANEKGLSIVRLHESPEQLEAQRFYDMLRAR